MKTITEEARTAARYLIIEGYYHSARAVEALIHAYDEESERQVRNIQMEFLLDLARRIEEKNGKTELFTAEQIVARLLSEVERMKAV